MGIGKVKMKVPHKAQNPPISLPKENTKIGGIDCKHHFLLRRASISKNALKDAHVKFYFCKIHVYLDLEINTKPKSTIKMGVHAPQGHKA